MSRAVDGPAEWVAVDWGTSRLRTWAMAGERAVAAAASDAGMAGLDRDRYEPALLALIGDWLAPGRRTQVIACGMVGARQGWVEAPYLSAPTRPHEPGRAVRAPARDPRLDVAILPGISQAEPPDVMRGEETQIAGYLSGHTSFSGTLCLPGTHSKWAVVAEGRIERFQTFLTGELFALLATSSVLRHSVGNGWDEAAFGEAVAEALAAPGALAARLFAIRAGSLLAGLSPEAARARLSGLLIGAEIAAGPGAGPVAVLGESALAQAYGAALAVAGRAAELADAEAATLNGLVAARATLAEGAA